MPELKSQFTKAEGLKLHYLECGEGQPVLLLHGWPTSSFLYRNILPEIGKTHRAIAIDLPGFGKSDKPTDVIYTYRYYERVLDGFLRSLGLNNIDLVVHDLGGPVGLYWACLNLQRVNKLVLLNTLVYPIPSFAAVAFIAACWVPGLNHWISSPGGLKFGMKFGMATLPTPEVIQGVQEPFKSTKARKALIHSIRGLTPDGNILIANRLPTFQGPVRIIYGKHDRILPDVAKTMARVKRELPQSELTVLNQCGHFLQEDNPDEVARLLSHFLNQENENIP